MNPKSELQEFCHLQKIELPKYVTERCGGTDHKPEFCSSVTVLEIDMCGDVSLSKRDAEISAAMHMLTYLKRMVTVEDVPCEVVGLSETPCRMMKEIIFIDLENASSCLSDIRSIGPERLRSKVLVGFLSSLSPMMTKIKEFENAGILVVSVKSSVKDAADVLLTVYLTRVLSSEEHMDYDVAIVTRDHYGGALLDVMRDVYPWRKIRNIGSMLEV